MEELLTKTIAILGAIVKMWLDEGGGSGYMCCRREAVRRVEVKADDVLEDDEEREEGD